jgi:hypothetical protein
VNLTSTALTPALSRAREREQDKAQAIRPLSRLRGREQHKAQTASLCPLSRLRERAGVRA